MTGRAVIFGDDAATYERSRPGYPREVAAHVAGLVNARTAVEVGSGTGKATEVFARPDLRLICVEPSAEMTEVLVAKNLPGVEVVVSTFEDWVGPDEPVDLMFAAQTWHWVNRTTGYDHARSMLRSGGMLALIWNIPQDRYGVFRDVYARHAPELLIEQDQRIRRRDAHDWAADLTRAGFEDAGRFVVEWSQELRAPEVRALYSTYSDHMMLPEPIRTALLDDLEGAVQGIGGSVSIEYRSVVFSGRA